MCARPQRLAALACLLALSSGSASASWIGWGGLGLQAQGDSAAAALDLRSLLDEDSRRVTAFGVSKGLVSSSVDTLMYGPDGKLWIGTPGGVVTFNGTAFRPLDVVEPQSVEGQADAGPQMESLQVFNMQLASDGSIWLGSPSRSLWQLRDGVPTALSVAPHLRWTDVLHETEDLAIWAGGFGLVRVEDGTVTPIFKDGARPAVSALAEEPGSSSTSAPGSSSPAHRADRPAARPLWIATELGLYTWNSATGLEQRSEEPSSGVFFDLAGRRWETYLDRIRVISSDGSQEVSAGFQRLQDMVPIDRNHSLLLAEGALYIADTVSATPRLTAVPFEGTVTAMLPAPGGGLWVASLPHGLQFWERQRHQTLGLHDRGHDLMTVALPSERRAYVGSWARPLSWVIPLDGNGRAAGPPEEVPWTSDKPMVTILGTHFTSESEGYLTVDGRLNRFSGSRLEPVPGLDAACEYIVQTSDGSVWTVGSLFAAEVRDGEPTGRRLDFGDLGVITAVSAHGLEVLIFAEGRVTSFHTGTLTTQTLFQAKGNVYGSHSLDPDGDLWISTNGEGLYRRRASGEVDHWGMEEGLPSRFVGWAGRLPGPTESSHLWIHTNVGLLTCSLDSLDAVAAGTAPGLDFRTLGTPEMAGTEAAVLPSGVLILPTIEGPISVDTRAPLPPPSAPGLNLLAIRAKGKPLESGETLKGSSDLAFEFESVEFPYPVRTRLQMRLDGFESDWAPVGPERIARYANLGPGDYSFELRALSNGGEFGPILRSPTVRIRAHWYERRVAQALIVAGALWLVAAAYRRRTKRLERHGRRLEGEVDRRRTAEARYRLLFKTTPAAIMVWTLDGLLQEKNQAAAELFDFDGEAQPVKLSDMGASTEAVKALEGWLKSQAPDRPTALLSLKTRVKGSNVHPCDWQLSIHRPTDGSEAGIITIVIDKSDEAQAAKDLVTLRSQLARAEEAERSRIARELHDDFSQRLAAMALHLRTMSNRLQGSLPPDDMEILDSSQEGLHDLATDVHTLSRQLHPTVLDDLGLVSALRSECLRRGELTEARIEFQHDGGAIDVRGVIGLSLYRVAQEALLNATKHAGAKTIRVTLRLEPTQLVLTVLDDGCGMDTENVHNGGVGLVGMAERMKLVGGELKLTSEPGEGTILQALVPWPASQSDEPVEESGSLSK